MGFKTSSLDPLTDALKNWTFALPSFSISGWPEYQSGGLQTYQGKVEKELAKENIKKKIKHLKRTRTTE